MPKGKIAIIAQAVKLADEVAGLNRTSYIAGLLAEQGYEVELITSTFQHWEKRRRNIVDEKYWSLPYNVVFLEEPGYKKNIGAKRIRSQAVLASNLDKYLERFGYDYDLIWCQIPPNNIAAVAGKYARKLNIPFIVDVNDLWPEAMKMVFDVPVIMDLVLHGFTKDAENAYACASAVVGTSDECANRCHQDIPHATVYVGGDIAVFDEGVDAFAGSIDKPADELWVTYAGSLAKSYDIGTLIRACKMAEPLVQETSGKKLRLMIMGDGPNRQKLEGAARKLEVAADFMGYVDFQTMAAYLSKSDMLVNSLIKNAPQSIVSKIGDYLCAGKPIINTGSSPEFMNMCVEDGFGINVTPENVTDLAAAILVLTEDEGLRERMGTNGRKIAEEFFDRPHSYQKIVELVNSLMQ